MRELRYLLSFNCSKIEADFSWQTILIEIVITNCVCVLTYVIHKLVQLIVTFIQWYDYGKYKKIRITDYMMYQLLSWKKNYHSIGQELCNAGSYEEVEQPHRLFSNPSQLNRVQNNDNKFFHTFTGW